MLDGFSGESNADAFLEERLTCRFIDLIARKEGVTHFFSDGYSRERANKVNAEVDQLSTLDSSQLMQVKLNMGDIDNDMFAMQLYNLSRDGVPIRAYRTECEDAMYPRTLFEEAARKVPAWIDVIESLGGLDKIAEYGELDNFNTTESIRFARMYNMLRERGMVDCIDELAGENNLLFLGRAHELGVIRELNDFTIHDVRIELYRGVIYLEGGLPQEYQPLIDNLHIPARMDIQYS